MPAPWPSGRPLKTPAPSLLLARCLQQLFLLFPVLRENLALAAIRSPLGCPAVPQQRTWQPQQPRGKLGQQQGAVLCSQQLVLSFKTVSMKKKQRKRRRKPKAEGREKMITNKQLARVPFLFGFGVFGFLVLEGWLPTQETDSIPEAPQPAWQAANGGRPRRTSAEIRGRIGPSRPVGGGVHCVSRASCFPCCWPRVDQLWRLRNGPQRVQPACISCGGL